MKIFDARFILAAATFALLTACGGGANGPAADQSSLAAPAMAAVNAPVADCEAEGCNRPRVVDGLAEQFRAGAIAAPAAELAQAGEPVRSASPAITPLTPVTPIAPMPPVEAGSAAGVTLQ